MRQSAVQDWANYLIARERAKSKAITESRGYGPALPMHVGFDTGLHGGGSGPSYATPNLPSWVRQPAEFSGVPSSLNAPGYSGLGGGAAAGAGSDPFGINLDDLKYDDQDAYNIYKIYGEPGLQAYYAKKMGWETAGGGGDLATTFGLSEAEWKSLSPEQQASLKNYVSRYDPTGGGGSGDPYAGQKMQLAWAQLAQDKALQEAQIAARRREMAAGIGQNVAQMRMQGWQTGLPWSLPEGSTFAPGLGPGGPLSQLYAMSGSTYNPQDFFLAENNPPSSDQLMNWVSEAMGRFG